nr:MAG TPA: hypothetical protein [Caudoviricetes sp.]
MPKISDSSRLFTNISRPQCVSGSLRMNIRHYRPAGK